MTAPFVGLGIISSPGEVIPVAPEDRWIYNCSYAFIRFGDEALVFAGTLGVGQAGHGAQLAVNGALFGLSAAQTGRGVFGEHGIINDGLTVQNGMDTALGAVGMVFSAWGAFEAWRAPGAAPGNAPRTGGAMSGGYRGTGLTQAEVDAATTIFRAAGGVVDQSVDAQQYLQTRGAGGLTFNRETILLPARPTRTAVFEELVHADQFSRGVTIEAGRGGVLRFEAEAAEILIQNRHAWQLPPDEVRQVIENLRNIRAELERLGAGH